ncbi:glycosyltransferase family 2 protein [Streptomyces sp. MA25(2023)]|uniref:glycosyltransferase n=1 Tax=Streptomyces sp. MA25(2023) TaxID=3055078 RepID=UPI0025B227E8|nr:glycosyltransferase family 2 protein [Streptomyces sp. MA25(2023)]MDN3254835.1 glycosyltransferase family 2 protein [Streptomyces sp. MA25(2023)]
MRTLITAAQAVAFGFVFLGALPLVTAVAQFLLVGLQRYRGIYARVALCLPRTAVLIPARNEAAVLETSIETLLASAYPQGRLRIFVIDDASTDDTPVVLARLAAAHPGAVVHLRRETGGQGKSHTLNHGLRHVLSDDWAQAVLVMDADVVFAPDTVWRMTRHLAAPEVGAVTAYIQEGSGHRGNYLTRYVAYEYITAQAAARRTQNVLGAVACLAGGAQLHSRANLEALGGEFDTSTLAEDTVTTFDSQLAGHRVVFDGYALVLAEEPDNAAGLWRQRLRWARGNYQVTHRYRGLWFRGRRTGDNRLGSWLFGLMWFSVLLTPFLMLLSAASLIFLFYTDTDRSWFAFKALWVVNLVSYLYVTLLSLAVDPVTARRSWREALIFPGLVSCFFLVVTAVPTVALPLLDRMGLGLTRDSPHPLMLFAYCWLALCMPLAWAAKCLATTRLRWLSAPLVHLVGYGSLLAACSLAAFVLQVRGAEQSWGRTVKTGKVQGAGPGTETTAGPAEPATGRPGPAPGPAEGPESHEEAPADAADGDLPRRFAAETHRDLERDRGLLWWQAGIMVLIVLLMILREIWLVGQ